MEIKVPIAGRSDLSSRVRQKEDASAFEKNFRVLNPRTGALTGGQRAGHSKLGTNALKASSKVQHLSEIVHENPKNTYTALGNASTVDATVATPNISDCYGLVRDTIGSVYVIDGQTGIAKLTPSALAKVWKQSLPAKERASQVRALAVDEQQYVFAGVSSGGDSMRAGLWGYRQIENNKVELVWTIEPGWFTECLWIDGVTLCAAQNDPIFRRSRIAVYADIHVENPTLIKEWEVPYPANFASASPVDGSVFVSHEPNSTRGSFPRSPGSTQVSEDWRIQDLANYRQRAYCWLSSQDVLGDDSNNEDLPDGENITSWIDKTGNSRDAVEAAAGKGFTLLKNRYAGRDTLFMNGTDQAMVGARGISTDMLLRHLNKSLVPCHAGSQYLMVIVARIPQASTRKCLFSQRYTTSNTPSRDRRIMVNAGMDTGPAALKNVQGQVQLYEETTSAAGAANTASGHPAISGAGNRMPVGGAFDADGLVLLSWVFNHGVTDYVSVPTLSNFRCNGRPVDRWPSRTGFETLEPACIGADLLNGVLSEYTNGEIMEYFVLGDWYETSASVTTPFSIQRLLEQPLYPDGVWNAGSTTELERIEGYFAHRCGIAHKLPSGHQALLVGRANANDADTITIGGEVYTFKTALTPTAGEVLIGTSAWNSLLNLQHAINGTGVRGTAYAAATTPHASCWSPGTLETRGLAGGNQLPMMYVQNRDARSVAFATNTQNGGVDVNSRMDWVQNVGGTDASTSIDRLNGGGIASGIYPHPYFLLHTDTSDGGPPSSTSSASLAGGLSSPYGMLTKWDPVNGRLKNVLTTSGPGFSGLAFGGIGYGHVILSDGSIVCTGPRQAAVSVLGTSVDNVDIRKVVDTATGFVVTNGATALLAWTAAPGAQTYQYPRLDCDRWDNAYVPIYQGSTGTSAAVYLKVAPSASVDSALLYTVTSITADPRGHAIVVDREYPDYPSTFTNPRAERFYLATKKEGSDTMAVHAIRQVSAAPSGLAPRVITRLAVAGGELHKLNAGGASTQLDANFLSASARFIDSATLYGVRYYTDGTSYKLRDQKQGISGGWRALRGQIPPRGQLLERFRKRLILGRLENPYELAMCQYGDALGWDFDPPGDSPLAIAAVRSGTNQLGSFGSPITCLCSIKDDLCVVGGENLISIMRGDPAQGGGWDTVFQGIGVAFGRARCTTMDGRFWFITDQAEWAVWTPGAGQPELLSTRIQRELSNAIDFSQAQVELVYDPDRRAIMLYQYGFDTEGQPSTAPRGMQHFCLELDTMALHPDEWGNTNGAASAACLFNGDEPEDRVFAIGGYDSYVRQIDNEAEDDDGTRIDAQVEIRLVGDNEQPRVRRFEHLDVLLSDDGGAEWAMLVGDDPNDLEEVASGPLDPGGNHPGDARVSAPFAALRIRSTSTGAHEAWGIERMNVDVIALGDEVGT